MQKICAITGQPFAISPLELEYCERNQIPLPTISPLERLRNLAACRNRLFLNNALCAFSKKNILSCFPPEKRDNVYDVEIWSSDAWDALEYGCPYDFSKPFFVQMHELFQAVPLPNLSNVVPSMENSAYTNGITSAKNCYLLFGSSYNEDCLFSHVLFHSRNILDSAYVQHSELCYQCTNAQNSYNLYFSNNCSNCSDSFFLSHCQSCKDCFGCVNLSNKQYCFENKQCTKEEYFEKLRAVDLGSYQRVEQLTTHFRQLEKNFPVKYLEGKNNENSSGHFIYRTKNCMNCYFVTESEDSEYCAYINTAKNCLMNLCFGNNSELIYNCVTVGDSSYNIKFCWECWPNVKDLEYCIFTGYGASNCFGCVGVKRKEYCILNRQYSKEEYLELLPRIKEHMRQTGEYGQFFPNYFTNFYYNQSDASFFFPLTKEEALKRGFDWKEEAVEPFESKYIIPDHIRGVQDDILQATLRCEKTGKQYKIIKQELDFYRQHNLPIPRMAPLERIKERATMFTITPLQTAACANCSQPIQTVYGTSDKKVYCEKCYVQEVY